MADNRYPSLLVAFLWVAFVFNYVDRQMVYSIFPALERDLGFTTAQLGLIGGIFSWVYSLGMPAAGRLADRFRRDHLILASVALWSLATIGCGIGASVALFLLWRSLLAATQALYYPAAVGLLAAVHSDATRSRALGIHQSAQLAGIVLGGWYGGWMADRFHWRAGFLAAGLAGLAWCVVLWRRLKPAPPPAAAQPVSFRDALGLFSSRCYLALCVAFFCFCSMLWIFYAWFPVFLYERYQLSMTESGFHATVSVQASCGLGVLAGGALADRLAKRLPGARFYVAAAGILLSAPFGYLTFAATSLDWAWLFAVGYGGFSGLMVANVFAASYDVINRAQFGLGAGTLNMIGGFAAAITIYLAGVVKASIGFAGLLQWVAAGAVLAAVALAVTVWRFLPREAAA